MIPFNKPYMTGKELWNIAQAHVNGHLAGDGPFTNKCHDWLEQTIGSDKALLTHSCTAALEIAANLLDLEPNDEVIMPSYTFVSTANAFVSQGATPVFVDIRPDTLNIDETKIERAITEKTRAIVPVHYSGVGCDMDTIMSIANRHGLIVIEDAAQGVMASYKDKPLGGIGQLGTLSFHETKNIIAGEGGALLINDPTFIERAKIIREKGTNRDAYFRGVVDKYTWVDTGSSYLPGEIIAAFLYAQIQEAEEITSRRIGMWNTYHHEFASLESRGLCRRHFIPDYCKHNAHMYYLLLNSIEDRDRLICTLKEMGIQAVFHYIPLHSSPAGKKFARTSGNMSFTDDLSQRLVRLPLWVGLEDKIVDIADTVKNIIKETTNTKHSTPTMHGLPHTT